MQFDAWSIGSGEDSVLEGKGGYRDETPEGVGDEGLCGIVMVQSVGFVNLGVLVVWLVAAVVPLVWGLGLNAGGLRGGWRWVVGWWRGKEGEGGEGEEDVERREVLGIPVFYVILWAVIWVVCHPARAARGLSTRGLWVWRKLGAVFARTREGLGRGAMAGVSSTRNTFP